MFNKLYLNVSKMMLLIPCVASSFSVTNVFAEDNYSMHWQATQKDNTMTGTVIDESGTPIIGASIALGNGQGGTITDVNGNFCLSVPLNAKSVKVTVSYVGMESQAVVLISGKPSVITLTEDSQLLDDVVVIGYGTEKKKNVAGAVSNIRSEELTKSSVESLQKALQGKVSGVQILTANGAPGAGMTVNVRGRSTISGGSSPLYIIDGVQVVTGDQSSGILDRKSVV